MRNLLRILSFLAVLVGVLQAQTPPSQAVAAGYSVPVFSDNFASLSLGTTDVAGYNWYTPGTWLNSSGGSITDPSGTYANIQYSTSTQPTQNGSMIVSASPAGTYHHAWTYGYIEISMEFDVVTGNWPTLWMLPLTAIGEEGTSNGAELDIVEYQSNYPNTIFNTAHVWTNGTGVEQGVELADATLTGFNTYGVLWTPTAISWYFNNALIGTISTTAAPYNTAFNQPMFLMLMDGAGCNWVYNQATPCSGQTSPINMKVAYVHVFQGPSGGGAQVSGKFNGVMQ